MTSFAFTSVWRSAIIGELKANAHILSEWEKMNQAHSPELKMALMFPSITNPLAKSCAVIRSPNT